MKKILITIILVLIIGGLAVFNFIQNRVPENAPDTLGNTSGNLINDGLFCEKDKKIYFSNPADSGKLYVMDHNLKNQKRLSDDTAQQINVAGNYIYYSRRNDTRSENAGNIFVFSNVGLYRMKKNGTNFKALYSDAVGLLNLSGNYLYYQHYDKTNMTQCYQTSITGKDSKMIQKDLIQPAAISNGILYYVGTSEDHYIHAMNLANDSESVLYDGNCASCIIKDGILYFLDLDHNYGISRIHTDGSGYELLVDEFISCYNISEDGRTLYYQIDGGDHNSLCSLDLESNTSQTILSGDYNSINTTSLYVFFKEFQSGDFYVMPYGEAPEKFTPVKED